MKYDLIIDGVVIPDQTYRGGDVRVGAHDVLKDLKGLARAAAENGREYLLRHVGPAGTHAVLVRWDQASTVQVRIHPEEDAALPA